MAAGVFVVIVEDVAILAILVVAIFVALVVAIALPLCPCMVVLPIPFPLRHARVFLVGCCMKNIDRLVGDVPVLAVLVVVIFVALIVTIAPPQMFSHGHAAYAVPPPSRPCVFGWLLRVKYRTAAI